MFPLKLQRLLQPKFLSTVPYQHLMRAFVYLTLVILIWAHQCHIMNTCSFPYRNIPPDIIQQYNLNNIAKDVKVYVEVRKGMYRLPQADILANKLLQKILQNLVITNVNKLHICGNTPCDLLSLYL